MRVLDLEQGGPDWLEWREKGIGASDAPIILGLSPWSTRDKLLLKKSEARRGAHRHRKGLQPDNGAMARGRRLEPVARDLYTSLTGIKVRPLCVVHDEYEWMKASLDGYSADPLVTLEIKCPNWQDHQEAIEGRVTEKYLVQCQHQLACTKTPICHYWSYTDNQRFSPRDQAVLVEIFPDFSLQERIFEAEKAFMDDLERIVLTPSWCEG